MKETRESTREAVKSVHRLTKIVTDINIFGTCVFAGVAAGLASSAPWVGICTGLAMLCFLSAIGSFVSHVLIVLNNKS